MVEDRAERPQFRGIPLVSPGEDIRHGSGLVGESHLIPEVGNVTLCGSNSSYKNSGLLLENDRLVLKDIIYNKDLFNLYLYIGFPK